MIYFSKGISSTVLLLCLPIATGFVHLPTNSIVDINAAGRKLHNDMNSRHVASQYSGVTSENRRSPFLQLRKTNEKRHPTTLQNAVNGDIDYSKLKPKVYPQRWVQLAYLSLLALLSDWTCFSVAASPSTFEMSYAGHSAANLVDIFLFTNVLSCFFVTDTVARFGLEKSIKGAAALMLLGCGLKSGFSFIMPMLGSMGIVPTDNVLTGAESLVPYWAIVTGTILVGASQPFFQITPPALSACWFVGSIL